MIQNTPLTASEMARSRFNYSIYCLINGVSYMCLGETVLILFAVKLNCPNEMVSVLGAMMYLGFLLLPLGKWMTARVGAAQSQASFWVMRNFAALIVALAAPVAFWISRTLSLWMIAVGAFFFYGFRAAGVVMSQPLLSEICRPEQRGSFVEKTTTLFYITGTATLFLICMTMRFSESIWVLAAVILTGAGTGFAASRFVHRIRESDQIRNSARKPLRQMLRRTLRDRQVRHQLCAGIVCNLAIILAQPVSILAMKRGYHIGDREALLFSLSMFAIKVAGGFLQTRYAGKLGPKKLLVFGYWLFAAVCLFWIALPSGLPPILLTIPLMLCGLATFTVENAVIFYFLMTVKKELQVVTSILISIGSGAGAGLAGMLLGSFLLKTAGAWQASEDPTRLYRIYFFMSLLFIVAGSFFIHRLEPVSSAKSSK